MVDFDLWTFNSRSTRRQPRWSCAAGIGYGCAIGNLSMWNHPIHIHGHKLWITGGDGGPLAKVRLGGSEVTEIVGVGTDARL